jgi:hypothetical protein
LFILKRRKQRMKLKQQYIRFSKHPIDEVLERCDASRGREDAKPNRVPFAGHMVNFQSSRIKVFKVHGTKCCECNLEGSFFALERDKKQEGAEPHLNLYAVDKDGTEIMLTKAMIDIAGKRSLENRCTVCYHCGQARYIKQKSQAVQQ